MSNTTQQTTPRHWQEIIANLRYFSEIERISKPTALCAEIAPNASSSQLTGVVYA